MRTLVIGGNAAGMTAAGRIKKNAPHQELVVLERGDWTSYAACGFPYVLGGLVERWPALVVRSAAQHRERGLDVRSGAEVTEIDLQRRQVRYRDAHRNEDVTVGFDQLVYATGSGASRPPIEGIELGFPVQEPRQAQRLGRALTSARRVLVVGVGYIGLEMAESLCLRGLETTLIDAGDQVMPTLDEELAGHVQRAVQDVGAEIRLGTPLLALDRRVDGTHVAHVGPDETLEADCVVLCLGSRPRAKLAAEAGIPLGESGAVGVDHRQRTPVEGVFAAGDCAEAWHRLEQRWVNVHLGTVANKTGRVAGVNAAGGAARFPGLVGTAVSRICDWEVARTGVTEARARELGWAVRSATIESRTRAGYYPDAGPIHVKLVARLEDGRLVGAQIVGAPGSGKRIDTVATAVTAGLDAQALMDLDLAYAPPVSPVWDPVQIAARQLA